MRKYKLKNTMKTIKKKHIDYIQVKPSKDRPSDVEIPNETTKKVLSDSKKGKNVKAFNTKDELFKDRGL